MRCSDAKAAKSHLRENEIMMTLTECTETARIIHSLNTFALNMLSPGLKSFRNKGLLAESIKKANLKENI